MVGLGPVGLVNGICLDACRAPVLAVENHDDLMVGGVVQVGFAEQREEAENTGQITCAIA
ncbi:hypothetical protein GCM10027590_27820 [Nocardiopsis nanhaiensis]